MGICCCGIYDCFEEVFDILSIFWRFLILVVFQFFSRPGSNMSKNDFNRDVKRKKTVGFGHIQPISICFWKSGSNMSDILSTSGWLSLSLYMYIYMYQHTWHKYIYIHIYIYTYTYIQPRKLGFSFFFRFNWSAGLSFTPGDVDLAVSQHLAEASPLKGQGS